MRLPLVAVWWYVCKKLRNHHLICLSLSLAALVALINLRLYLLGGLRGVLSPFGIALFSRLTCFYLKILHWSHVSNQLNQHNVGCWLMSMVLAKVSRGNNSSNGCAHLIFPQVKIGSLWATLTLYVPLTIVINQEATLMTWTHLMTSFAGKASLNYLSKDVPSRGATCSLTLF